MRIVSLVPSITETLFDLGLTTDEIVGRTKFCIHPKDYVDKIEIIGGTKNLSIDKIKSLKPDFIIANKEENIKEQVEELMKDFKVLVTNISNLEDNYYLLKTLGNLLGKQETAQKFNLKIYEILAKFSDLEKGFQAYLYATILLATAYEKLGKTEVLATIYKPVKELVEEYSLTMIPMANIIVRGPIDSKRNWFYSPQEFLENIETYSTNASLENTDYISFEITGKEILGGISNE